MEGIKEIHNNYDAVFKEALLLYKNKTLDFLGLDLPAIDEPLNTEMTEVKVDKKFSDMGFRLKDKTGLHTEWEADISSDDLLRFCSYNINYTRAYHTKFTTVIFTNKRQAATYFDNGMVKFTPIIINLGERDGDALLEKIKTQIENHEPVNPLEVIYLPLYHSEYKSVAEMLGQVIELAPRVSDSKAENEKIMIMSAVLANKLVDDAALDKIWEAIRMHMEDMFFIRFAKEDGRKEGEIEGRKKGEKEGRKEGRKEGEAKGEAKGKAEIVVNMFKKGLDINTIAEWAGLTIEEIEKIKEESMLVNS